MRFTVSALLFLLLLLPHAALSSTLNLSFATPAGTSKTQLQLLAEAERFWETLLPGYQPGITINDVVINVYAFDIDGEDGFVAFGRPNGLVKQSGYTLPTRGSVDFDTADLNRLEASGTLFEVLLHEVAHVLGFGTLWEANGVYEIGSGQYTGTNAVNAYRAEFDPVAEFVPAELDGAPGTRDAHWDETWAGGPNELMTGYVEPPLFLSETTIASFRDLGYETRAVVTAIPLPSGIWLTIGGFGLLMVPRLTKRRLRTG
ncbi:MAG: leishmanolysin-related zinc metalloendopeptidase [Paracoccaceae bacterium]|nr:leishmanolysin-related zinc metalloendopeptidase [Paracoccaceae bacterium]